MKASVVLMVCLTLCGMGSLGVCQAFEDFQVKIQVPSPPDCAAINLDDSAWPQVSLWELPSGKNFCLRGKVHISEGSENSLKAIAFSLLGSSNVYWDGEELVKNGVVGRDATSERPGKIDVVLPLSYRMSNPGEHLLAMEISNFHIGESLCSNFYYFLVMDYSAVNMLFFKKSGLALVFIGGLLLIGVLFQLYFWLYQRQDFYQFFSLLSFSFFLLLLAEKWRALFGYSYDFHVARLHTILGLTFVSCLLWPSFYLVYYQLGRKQLWLVLVIFILTLSAWAVPGYDGKGVAMFFSAIGVCAAINVLALKQRKPKALANFVMVLVVLFGLAYEPYAFMEDRFALISFALVLVIMVSLIREMKDNREAALTALRLEAELLRRNLQPHFLMNSLMLAIEWIEQKPIAAAEFVHLLAEELRMLVSFSGKSCVTLREEIALCNMHLGIMSYRFNANYTLSVDGDENAINIPPALVHTQIENAFSHNCFPEGAHFHLAITRNLNHIELCLRSPLSKHRQHSGSGIGDQYIHSRLAAAFEGQYDYNSGVENGFWVGRMSFRIR